MRDGKAENHVEIRPADAHRMARPATVSTVYPRPVFSLAARIAAIPFVVALVALLLSDRAPGLTRSGLSKGLVVGRKVEGRTGIDIIDHTDVPFSWEQVGHSGLWAVAMLLAYLVFVNRASIVQIASGVFAASAAFELGQVFFTSSRLLEWGDLMANGTGVVIGAGLAAVFGLFTGRGRHVRASARSITG